MLGPFLSEIYGIKIRFISILNILKNILVVIIITHHSHDSIINDRKYYIIVRPPAFDMFV